MLRTHLKMQKNKSYFSNNKNRFMSKSENPQGYSMLP